MAGAHSRSLDLTREQILAYRRRVQVLDERLPPGEESLRCAAWAGLQDSVPRSALHALHARVDGVGPDAWEDPALSQVWGPRYTAYVVPAGDHIAFTLGRLPKIGRLHDRAYDLGARLHELLADRRVPVDEAARGLGLSNRNALRYASLTGEVLIRWSGARQPTIWMIHHDVDPYEARLELVRRYLHVYGPSTVESFVKWAGVSGSAAVDAFHALGPALIPVRTPLGDAQILAENEPMLNTPPTPTDAARLLPSGDLYYLLWCRDRDLVVPDPARRDLLWTPRVWPGAVLVGGEIVGTWRRADTIVIITPWRAFSALEHAAVEAEAIAQPPSDLNASMTVRWDETAMPQ